MSSPHKIDRRLLLKAAALLPANHLLGGACKTPWEWCAYSADAASSRHAPLKQINTENVEHLEVAWELETLPEGYRPQGALQCNPIVVDGVMYVSGHGLHTHAIEAHSGRLIWSNKGFESGRRSGRASGTSRGVTY